MGRLRDWWHVSFFNRLDLLVSVLAATAFVLHISPAHFMYAKSVYAVNCVVVYTNFLRFYTANSYLGPKLVMIARMVGRILNECDTLLSK